MLVDLISLPEVSRVGFALVEGAGRRLRFVATDDEREAVLTWTHIDAYDDFPLTAVARTGEAVFGGLDELEPRFPEAISGLRAHGTRALAAWPLPGLGSPIGGLIVFFDADQSFAEPQRRLIEATARRTAEAVRRVRIITGRGPEDAAADDPALIGEGERVGVLLEGDPRAASAARRFLRERLEEWGIDDDTIDNAQLCLSELVTNAIIHAQTTSELTLHLEHRVLTVVVRDLGGSSGSGNPASFVQMPDGDDPMRVFGRGLTLVDALADRWGSEQDASGTTAWFVLELDRPEETTARYG
ncbi:MAG: ATP-binding region ATPase domain protein [Nocardioides sp.]|nr:ATP-binding region ATPase domain protein [Nocardioides sp.]